MLSIFDRVNNEGERDFYHSSDDYNFEFKYNSKVIFTMRPNGIRKYTLDAITREEIMSMAFTWDNFDIKQKYLKTGIDRPIFYYNFELDGHEYNNVSLDDMKRIFFNEFCNKNTDKLALNPLLRKLRKDSHVKDLVLRDVWGFTKEGWTDPNVFYFDTVNGYRIKRRDNFKKMFSMDEPYKNLPWSSDEIVSYLFRELYNITGIQYKDLIFAYCIVAVFLYSLRDKIGLLPCLALGGDAQLGKTKLSEALTVKFWGIFESVIGATKIKTPARADAALSSGTAPAVIDDAEHIKPHFEETVKTYTTTEDTTGKLNSDQSIGMDATYCTSLILTFNLLPEMFKDVNFRQRLIYLDIKWTKQHDDWLLLFDEFDRIKGAWGNYFIKKTKDMTFDDLYNLYLEQDDMKQIDSRAKAIAKVFNLGKYFAKKLFDIDLDVTQLPIFIQETRSSGSEAFTQLVQQMIVISNTMSDDDMHRNSWVKNRVERRMFKKEEGYTLYMPQWTDINNYIKEKLSGPKLAQHLHSVWPDVFYGTVGKDKCIFIPSKYIPEGKKIAGYDHYSKHETEQFINAMISSE